MSIPKIEDLEQLKKEVELALGMAKEAFLDHPIYLLSPCLREMAGEAAKKALDKFLAVGPYLRLDV